MIVFVTGSTGLLGSNAVALLLAQGHTVRALARSRSKAETVLGSHPNLEIVVGDMENVDGLRQALAGTDVLFHTAAYFQEYFGPGDHWPRLKAINVDATIRLLETAEAQGVGKCIHVSSSGALGGMPDGRPADESAPPDAHTMANLYAKSKLLAEEAITAWLPKHHLPVVLILPTVMIGPSDTGPTRIGQVFVDLIHRKLPLVPPGGFEFVDVRDVAQAMISAIAHGRSGERYIVSEGYHTMRELAHQITRASGIPAPRLFVPYPILILVARLLEVRAARQGVQPQMPVAGLRLLYVKRPVTAAKAIRELGIRLRGFDESVRDQIAWFRANGYIRA